MPEIINGQPSAADVSEHVTSDEAATALNTTHRSSDGSSHSKVVSAIHGDVAAEINTIDEKESPADADLVIIEDSAASNAKKKVQVGNLPGGGAETFPALTDTPANYTGQAGNTVVVKGGENGLEFGAAPGGTFTSKCSVCLDGNVAIVKDTWTKVPFNSEIYDTDGEYDHVTNYRFQPASNGYYHIDASAVLLLCDDGKWFGIAIVKTGAFQATAQETEGWLGNPGLCISRDIYLTTEDYIEIEVIHSCVSNRNIQGLIPRTALTVHRFA